jgi:hypothetical protein
MLILEYSSDQSTRVSVVWKQKNQVAFVYIFQNWSRGRSIASSLLLIPTIQNLVGVKVEQASSSPGDHVPQQVERLIQTIIKGTILVHSLQASVPVVWPKIVLINSSSSLRGCEMF